MRIVQYLRDNPELRPVMSKLKENYIKHGCLRGYCRIDNPTPALRILISRILRKKDLLKGDFNFLYSAFVSGLRRVCTGNDGEESEETVLQILETYFGTFIITNPQVKEQNERNLASFFDSLADIAEPAMRLKIKKEFEQEGKVYAYVKSCYKTSEKKAMDEWSKVHKMWAYAADRVLNNSIPVKIAVLSDMLLGEPHGLDGSPYRGLFFYLLSRESGLEYSGKSTENEVEFLSEFNIYIDTISSFVNFYNIENFIKGQNVFSYDFRESPHILTLDNILAIEEFKSPKSILVVENPSVFESLVPYVNKTNMGLICTHGNLRISLIKYLDMIILYNPECRIFYNGDFDVGGITIANRMLNRFGDYVELVFYDVDTYLSLSSTVEIKEDKMLLKAEKVHPLLQEIAAAIADRGIACYQESIIDKLAIFVSK